MRINYASTRSLIKQALLELIIVETINLLQIKVFYKNISYLMSISSITIKRIFLSKWNLNMAYLSK